MDDIIERAEATIDDLARNGEPLSSTAIFAPIFNELIAALKAARAENERHDSKEPTSDIRELFANALTLHMPGADRRSLLNLTDVLLSLPGIAVSEEKQTRYEMPTHEGSVYTGQDVAIGYERGYRDCIKEANRRAGHDLWTDPSR